MNESTFHSSRSFDRAPAACVRLPWAIRIFSLVVAGGVLGLLVTARCLEPSTNGLGTHQQLGLPPCTSIALWNTPCPACGMTTSWALATRGNWLAAMRANSGGFLLAIIALAYLPASCYFFAKGRATRGGWFSLALGVSILASLMVAVLQWWLR